MQRAAAMGARVLPLTDARLAHQLAEGSAPGGQASEKPKGQVVVIMPVTAQAP